MEQEGIIDTYIAVVKSPYGCILNIDELQLTIHMPIKLTSTSDLMIKITKVRFQYESQTGLNSE